MISSMRLTLMKLVVSRSILKIATAESRSSPIVFLRYVLIRRKAEKDRSAEHDEVGMRLKFFPFPPFLSFFFLFFFPFLFFFSFSLFFLFFPWAIYSPTLFTVRRQGRPWTSRTSLAVRRWGGGREIRPWKFQKNKSFSTGKKGVTLLYGPIIWQDMMN